MANLEASHLYLDPKIENKEWFIRDEAIEKLIDECTISYKLDIVPNTWHSKGRRINFTVVHPKYGAGNFHMQIMIGNCGAAVLYGVDYSPQMLLKVGSFIAKNIASYSGIGIIMASGHAHSMNFLKEHADWNIYSTRESSRGGYAMAYGNLDIPKEQMAKKDGYNYVYG